MGVDCLHTRDVRHTHRLPCRHVLAVRSIPLLAHCKAVFIPESNLAFESQHLLHALEANGIKNWVSLSEGQQGALGWLTTAGSGRRARALPTAKNAARGSSPDPARPRARAGANVSAAPRGHERRPHAGSALLSVELEKLEARKRIKDELLNYCVVTEAPKTTFGKVRKTYTGKLYGKQDDLAIAIQLAMIGCQKFFHSNNTHPNSFTHLHDMFTKRFNARAQIPSIAISESVRLSLSFPLASRSFVRSSSCTQMIILRPKVSRMRPSTWRRMMLRFMFMAFCVLVTARRFAKRLSATLRTMPKRTNECVCVCVYAYASVCVCLILVAFFFCFSHPRQRLVVQQRERVKALIAHVRRRRGLVVAHQLHVSGAVALAGGPAPPAGRSRVLRLEPGHDAKRRRPGGASRR